LLKDYEITIFYHPEKANMVVHALITKAQSMGSLAYFAAAERPLAMDVQALLISLQDWIFQSLAGFLL